MSAHPLHIRLRGVMARTRAIKLVSEVPDDWIVTVRPPTRSSVQNAKMWAMLSDVSKQMKWHGENLSADDWKDLFTAALRGSRFVPGLEAGTVVPLGMRTSAMSVSELSDLIESIYAWGASQGVVWSEEIKTEVRRS